MKLLIPLTVCLLFVISSFGQQTNPQPVNYLEKSKNQKKVGRILLATGGGLILTGVVFPRGKLTKEGIPGGGFYLGDEYKNDGLKGALILIGGVSALASIPFFISSRRNAKKAASVGFKNEDIIFPYKNTLAYTSLPAVSVKVNF